MNNINIYCDIIMMKYKSYFNNINNLSFEQIHNYFNYLRLSIYKFVFYKKRILIINLCNYLEKILEKLENRIKKENIIFQQIENEKLDILNEYTSLFKLISSENFINFKVYLKSTFDEIKERK